MTPEIALALGRAIAHVFRESAGLRKQILIGKDTRLSGYMFEDALAAGICSMGVDVIQVGPVPTPALAFLTRDMRCNAGVMITASHNPYQDNGIKFFAADGFKLPDALEARIEALIESGEIEKVGVAPDEIGQAHRIDDARGRYVVYLKNTFPRDLTLEGMRIVIDCANGAGYRVGPTVLRELGAEVFELGCEPNGRNINDDCGSLHPERAAARVRELRADVGIALDGDADRVVVIDERGEVLDGDVLMWLCARAMHQTKGLSKSTVVATVMSNLGLERALASIGWRMERSAGRDRDVVEAMRDGGFNLGGEQSGHVLFLDHSTTGDGLMTALQVLALCARGRRRPSQIVDGVERYPQVTVNVVVAEKRPLESLPSFQKAVAEVEEELGDAGRILVRYSGTENKARVMVEGRQERRVEEIAHHLARTLERALAVRNSPMRIVASLARSPPLRDFAGDDESELVKAASLAELAGVDALRLGVQEELAPVRESDVVALRGAARALELRMPIAPGLAKLALSTRPDRVVLVGDRHAAVGPVPPVDVRVAGPALAAQLRNLAEARLAVSVRVAPELDAVRAAHAAGVADVELFTGFLVDLPEQERRAALVGLGDAARLASKLRMGIALAGGLDDRNLRDVIEAAPAAERVVLGRSLARRALLVGLDRAVRDHRDRMR